MDLLVVIANGITDFAPGFLLFSQIAVLIVSNIILGFNSKQAIKEATQILVDLAFQ